MQRAAHQAAERGSLDLTTEHLLWSALEDGVVHHFVQQLTPTHLPYWINEGIASLFEQFYLPEVTDEDARAALEELGAVGMSGTTEGEGEGRFTLRLVADEE